MVVILSPGRRTPTDFENGSPPTRSKPAIVLTDTFRGIRVPGPFRSSRRPAISFGSAASLAVVTAVSLFLMEIYHTQDPNYAPLLL